MAKEKGTPFDDAADKALRWIRQELAFERLPAGQQEEVAAQLLATIFLRKIYAGREINRHYVSKVLTYHRNIPNADPFVAKARKRADERQRWGLQSDVSALAMAHRSSPKEPITELIEKEEFEAREIQLEQIGIRIQVLDHRARAVMEKFLRGAELTQAERCVQHRTIQKLRSFFSHHN